MFASLVDSNLLEVEQHGPRIRPVAPATLLGKLLTRGTPDYVDDHELMS